MRRDSDAGVIVPRSPLSGATRRPARRRTGLARLVGGLGMLALATTLLWLLTDDSFRVTAANVRVEGVRFGDEAAIRDQIRDLDRVPNVFRVRASEFVAEMRALPEVSSASAVVTLPAAVSVRITEREPLFRWTDGKQTWLVDGSGVLFAQLPAPDGPETSPSAVPVDAVPELLDMPEIEDYRLLAEPLSAGSQLPHIDLAVMRQLLALTPDLLASSSTELTLSIDQDDGYVLRSDLGWQAVFGHYTPTLQPAEVAPRQVQCLTWLLAAREHRLERVRLAVSPEGCGTFTTSGGRN